jgi:acetoin utilization deacetylase AcuC-like enzyme
VLEQSRPDVAVYVAGVDPAQGDRFGRLGLSAAGIAQRERYVLQSLRSSGTPVAIVMGGGYQATPEQTAELHAIVHHEVDALSDRRAARSPANA